MLPLGPRLEIIAETFRAIDKPMLPGSNFNAHAGPHPYDGDLQACCTTADFAALH